MGPNQRIWSLYISPYIYEKDTKFEPQELEIVWLENSKQKQFFLSSWNDPTNFYNKNKAEIDVYLTKHFIYRNLSLSLSKSLKFSISEGYTNFGNGYTMPKYTTRFQWSIKLRDSSTASSPVLSQ